MPSRDYGPIPRGVWRDEDFRDLTPSPRAVFLSILGVCCYRGRFPRNAKTLLRAIAWHEETPASIAALDRDLVHLEQVGLTRSWWGRNAKDRTVNVGEVIGYHEYDGLPKDRRNKQPGTLEWPDRDSSLSGGLQGSLPGDSPPAPPALPAASPVTPRPLPSSLVKPSEAQLSPPTEGLDAHTREDSPQQQQAPPTSSAPPSPGQQPPHQPQPPPTPPDRGTTDTAPLQLPTLDEMGNACVAELQRRMSNSPWGNGKHSGGFFGNEAREGLLPFSDRLANLRVQDPGLYRGVCMDFWPSWDRKMGRPDEVPNKPVTELEQFAQKKGNLPSGAVLAMRQAAGGGA